MLRMLSLDQPVVLTGHGNRILNKEESIRPQYSTCLNKLFAPIPLEYMFREIYLLVSKCNVNIFEIRIVADLKIYQI